MTTAKIMIQCCSINGICAKLVLKPLVQVMEDMHTPFAPLIRMLIIRSMVQTHLWYLIKLS